MKKNQFIKLIVCVVAGLFFAIGMCMCLLPEWNLFTEGVIFAAIGGVALLIMGLVAYFKNVKNKTPINWKIFGKIVYAVLSALILGGGMCLIMVWNLILPGIIVGVVGLVMLLFLIPMFLGFKD